MMLAEYLKDATTRPWHPAVHDCCAMPARWADVPLPPYSTDAEGQALIEAAGSLLELVAPVLDARFPRAHAPQEGDVGVIVAVAKDFAVTQMGAIYTGRRWAFAVAPGGIGCVCATALAVWRV